MNEQYVCELINEYIELKKIQNHVLYTSKNQISLHAPNQLQIEKEQWEHVLKQGCCLSSFILHDDQKFSFRLSTCYHSAELLNIEFLHAGKEEQELIQKLRKYLYKEEVNCRKKYRWYQLLAPEKRGLYSWYNGVQLLNLCIVQKTLQDIVSLEGNGGISIRP